MSYEMARIKDNVDDVIPSRWMSKQLRSSDIRNVRFCFLMTTNVDVLSLLKSVHEGREKSKEVGTSHLDRKGFPATRASFVFLSIEWNNIYINNPTKATAFHILSFNPFQE